MNYTKPALREKLKKQLLASNKGGKPGQWSARKSQMLAVLYEKAGGGYIGKKVEFSGSATGEGWWMGNGTNEGNYSFQPRGLTIGIKNLTPITKHWAFTFELKNYFALESKLNERKSSVDKMHLKTGLAYSF